MDSYCSCNFTYEELLDIYRTIYVFLRCKNFQMTSDAFAAECEESGFPVKHRGEQREVYQPANYTSASEASIVPDAMQSEDFLQRRDGCVCENDSAKCNCGGQKIVMSPVYMANVNPEVYYASTQMGNPFLNPCPCVSEVDSVVQCPSGGVTSDAFSDTSLNEPNSNVMIPKCIDQRCY